jgi:membrane protease YdiL (CAAX protease family)
MMDELSPEPRIAERQVAARSAGVERTTLIWVAWIATLLLSKLPLVIARDLLGSDIPWIVPAWLATAGLLIVATFVWPAIRPLRGYFILMAVLLVIGFGLTPLISGTAAWSGLFPGLSDLGPVFKDRLLLLLQTLIVIAILFLLGLKRRDAFLVVGDLRAPVGGRTAPARKRALSWAVLGPIAALGLGALFFWFMSSQNPGALANPGVVLPWLPLILVSAGLNAFGEEVSYRAGPISLLLPGVGPGHALWMTSIWFGLGHYYGGIPSGPFGLVQSGLVALLMGKAMLDTRGLGWPWTIHVVLDTVIYLFIAATMAGAA